MEGYSNSIAEDVARRQPDAILPYLRLFTTAREAAGTAHRVGEFAHRRYASPIVIDPYGYRLRIVQHGPDAFWPVLVRGFEIGGFEIGEDPPR